MTTIFIDGYTEPFEMDERQALIICSDFIEECSKGEQEAAAALLLSTGGLWLLYGFLDHYPDTKAREYHLTNSKRRTQAKKGK